MSRAAFRPDGLTGEEGIVSDALVTAVEAFARLDRQHPDELRDFVDGIHRCQGQLALRIVRRDYPDGWPTKRRNDVSKLQVIRVIREALDELGRQHDMACSCQDASVPDCHVIVLMSDAQVALDYLLERDQGAEKHAAELQVRLAEAERGRREKLADKYGW